MYSTAHFNQRGRILIYTYMYITSESNFPASLLLAVFLLSFYYTFTRAHLAEDNCRAKRFCLRKD